MSNPQHLEIADDLLIRAEEAMREHADSRSLKPDPPERAARIRWQALVGVVAISGLAGIAIPIAVAFQLSNWIVTVSYLIMMLAIGSYALFYTIAIIAGLAKAARSENFNPSKSWVSINRPTRESDIAFIGAMCTFTTDELKLIGVWLEALRDDYRSRFRFMAIASVPTALLLAGGKLSSVVLSNPEAAGIASLFQRVSFENIPFGFVVLGASGVFNLSLAVLVYMNQPLEVITEQLSLVSYVIGRRRVTANPNC